MVPNQHRSIGAARGSDRMTAPAKGSTSATRMTPRISVVIPVLNRAAVVRRAIASVLAQTFQDFEIVVVDDGSTDGTAESVDTLSDRRIRVIRHEQTLGGGAARNTGIRASRAPFVAFLDSDDEWVPTKLEKQLGVFDNSG